METREVSRETRLWVGELLQKIDNIPQRQKALGVLVSMESQLSLQALKQLLQRFLQVKDVLTPNKARPFCNFLADRWYFIKNTDGIYSHHPETAANQASLLLAEQLRLITNENIYELIMPPIMASYPKLTRGNLNNYRLHEFIIADDGSAIDVAECLDRCAVNRSDLLCHPTTGRPLNKSEAWRIINHSSEADDYYNAIQFYIKTGIDNDLNVAKALFHKAIISDDYKVSASYGDEGERKIARSILLQLPTREALIDGMVTLLKLEDWPEFLRYVVTPDLIKVVLGKQTLVQVTQDFYAYNGQDLHDRAVFYLLLEIYKRIRIFDGKYKNPLGYFSRYTEHYLGDYNRYLMGSPKEQKLEVVNVLQSFLLSERPLNQLEGFVAANDEVSAILSEILSDLTTIYKQMCLVAQPKFFEKKPSQSFFGFLGL